MDVSLKKKLELEQNDIERELSVLEEHLLKNCLCALPENIQKLFWENHLGSELLPSIPSEWSRDQVLMFVTSIQLIFEIAIRQSSKGFVCSGIAKICNTLVCNDDLIEFFLRLADNSDEFVSFATSRALSSLLILNKYKDQGSVTIHLLQSAEPSELSFSLDVLKRIMEWKDFDEHTLEDTLDETEPVSDCQALEVSVDFEQVKCECINSLKNRWPEIVRKFNNLVLTNPSFYQSGIIAFLNLWEAIISIKANLSVIDTKPFYSSAYSCVSLLSRNTPSIIWKHILSLLNEILCYGTTLALQSEVAEEPCSLAYLIVRKINIQDDNNQLLRMVPYGNSSAQFGNGTGECDKVLLQRLTLLVLKTVAITVKQASSGSSSDSSVGSGNEDASVVNDMITIEKSMIKVLTRLDKFVKDRFSYHPQTPLAKWIVRVTLDQDDCMIESMLCCLDVSLGLCYRKDASQDLRRNALQDLRRKLNPNVTFLEFLEIVSFDEHRLLDFLISNETCFLFYILKYLKYLTSRNADEFWHSENFSVHNIIDVLMKLRDKIQKLVDKGMFPYNITPVLRYLTDCEILWAARCRRMNCNY